MQLIKRVLLGYCIISALKCVVFLVVKFKRRPQYLEYFVHLCEKVMKEGKGELILNWSVDVFSWLAK